jgi:hypothetical protein
MRKISEVAKKVLASQALYSIEEEQEEEICQRLNKRSNWFAHPRKGIRMLGTATRRAETYMAEYSRN